MRIQITKINVGKNVKTDKNGKNYKTCGIESNSLNYVYFYNVYDQNSPVLGWKKGDYVDVELTDKGEWHNFSPITAYKPSLNAVNSDSNAPRIAAPAKTAIDTKLELMQAEIAELNADVKRIYGTLNDLQNDGTFPE